MATTTTVNVPFPWPVPFDGASGIEGVVALQPTGASVAQTGDINVSGSITGSNLVTGNVKVGTLAGADADAENWIEQANVAKTALVLQAKASATDSVIEVQDSSAAVLFAVSPQGVVRTGALTTNGIEQQLAHNTAVDFNTLNQENTLYTVPTSRSCMITRVIISAASTSLTTASVSFGFNAGTDADVIANATHTELTGATLYTVLTAKAGSKIGVAGTNGTFAMKTNTAQGGAATATIDVYGILF